MPDEFDLDLFADTAQGDVRDPHPEYAQKRREHPVEIMEFYGHKTHKVYRYADVDAILRDPETYSSRGYQDTMGLVLGPTILGMDGREHHAHRGLVASAFRRRAIENWTTALIEPTVHELIDRFIARGNADLVREFTFQFPVRIIAKMLGIPSDDYGRFTKLSAELIAIAQNPEKGLAASASLREYFAGIVQERRTDPREDVISTLATAEIDGERLDDEHIYGFLRLLLPAGAETTYRLLGNLLFGLLTDPDQLAALRADRSLLPNAIEEALRWEAPVQVIAREPTKDVEVAGFPIPAGTAITVCLGSANRDESVFEDPDRYDLRRANAHDHLAFAEGPHRCLGEHLGRAETTVAMNAFLDRLHDLELAPGDADPHVHGLAFRSPNALPVTFRPIP
ncbi:MAG: cytochrome P450 [Actinomycetota bacterium]